MKFWEFAYQDSWILWFLLVIPVMVIWYVLKLLRGHTTIKTSSLKPFEGIGMGILGKARHGLFVARCLAVACLILVLARPQLDQDSDTFVQEFTEGIDIVIALDISNSMLAQDFKPNRLVASKEVGKEFISDRKNDKIGLVVYGSESFTQCPLTTDKRILLDLFDQVENGMIEGGTAIGMGLATAVNRLRESEAPSKVVILLTDGVNTHGNIHPIAAAEIAKEFGVRVYTIGVGTNGQARFPVGVNPFNGQMEYTYQPVEIDEKTLEEISNITDGKYFRATNKKSLEKVYESIDKLEKQKIETIEFHVDLPEQNFYLLLSALLLLGIEFTLRNSLFKTAP